MAEKHPIDYPVCIVALAQAIAEPTFIGQDPKHAFNFEMIKRLGLPDGRSVLVAIGLEPDEDGLYRVKSCYLLTPEEVQRKRLKGSIKVVVRP